MKFFPHSAIALLAVFSAVVDLRAQESELGSLPPLPNLDLGDPDTELTWNQNQLRKKIVAQERRMEEKEAKLREAEKPEGPSVAKRIASSLNQPQKAAMSQKITVQNSLPSGEDGITASGSRLRAFGDENFWGAMPEPTPEESLADLPPLPDLRSSDQVTKKERLRDSLVEKQELRKAEADAAREERELIERVVVTRPAPHPSTALIQVQSHRDMGVHSISPEERRLGPISVNPARQRLQPFGDAQYWGPRDAQVAALDELLIDLPPIPDLRVSDQVTRKERLRDSLVAKQELRSAEADAAREQRELMQRAVVNRPPADPSTALVQLESRRGSVMEYSESQVAPATPDDRTLKPFDENSVFYQGNTLLFRGNKGNSSTGGGLFGRKAPNP